MSERKLEHERSDELDGREYARPHVFVLDAEVQDGHRNEHAHGHADIIDGWRIELELHPRGAQIGHCQPYGCHAYDEPRGSDNRVSRPVVAHDQQDASNNQREKD